MLSSPFTRMPLWRERPDNFVGVLHSKDMLRALNAAGGDASKLDVDEVMFAPWFVPEATTLEDQLEAFLKRKTHFALVVDEYGEVMGLVTLEDILEEIVGDIRDEHDLAVQGVRPQPDGSVLVDGAVPVRDLNRVMAWDLPDEEATTIAGLVIHEAGAIPEAGQVFTYPRLPFRGDAQDPQSHHRPAGDAGRGTVGLIAPYSAASVDGLVVEYRREPAFDLRDRHALAPRVILDLIALDLGDAEIMRAFMREIESADGGGRRHGETFGQLHAGALFARRADRTSSPFPYGRAARDSRAPGECRDRARSAALRAKNFRSRA